jgi:hypothetical protein
MTPNIPLVASPSKPQHANVSIGYMEPAAWVGVAPGMQFNLVPWYHWYAVEQMIRSVSVTDGRTQKR